NENRKRAEAIAQSFDARTCAAIKPKVANRAAECAARRVSQIIAREPTKRSPQQNFREAISYQPAVIEKTCVRQDAGQQQCQVALEHHQRKHAVQSVQFDQMRKKVKAGHVSGRRAVGRRQRTLKHSPCLLPTAYCSLTSLLSRWRFDDQDRTLRMAHHGFSS